MTQERETWFGHPRGLAILFGAELWERFSYYGMRALLVLYLIHAVGQSESEAYALYGVYGAVVYTLGVVGGAVAQRFIGELRAILVGGALMAAGHLVMALPVDDSLYWALALLCVGNGLFKPNVSSSVGALYEPGDRRRQQGYYLFYMGINLGAMAAPIACGAVAEALGWHWGFGLAGAGMVVGLAVVVRGRRFLRPRDPQLAARFDQALTLRGGLALLAFVVGLVPLCALLLWRERLGHLAILAVSVVVLVILLRMAFRGRGVERRRVFALLILMLFHTAFWAAFEQVGSSFAVLADAHVDRMVLGVEIPAASLVAVNGLLVIALSPVIGWVWGRLDARGLEPSVAIKFALGLLLLALGFLALALGIERGIGTGEIDLGAMLACYLLITLGELCLSPVGLAVVGELSPRGAASFCMGAWFLTDALGHLLAGWIAGLTEVEAGARAATALARYSEVFSWIGVAAVALAVVLGLLSPTLGRLMGADER